MSELLSRLVKSLLLLAILALALSSQARAQSKDDQGRLKRLVDKIATGDEVEAAAASEQLIELVTSPLVEAIGSLEGRPVEEQLRLRQILARVTGALRLRIYRMDLSPADRKLVDRFAKVYPELTERLFDGNWQVRKAAVLQIPLESNTGAGLLIAARVNDEDPDVAMAALDMAAALHDQIVARALTRYIKDATSAVEGGFYGPHQRDLAVTVGQIVAESIEALAKCGERDSVPVIIESLSYFGRSKYWDQSHRARVLRVLAELKDKRAVPVMLEFLDDPARLRWGIGAGQKRATETVGDVALQCLLRFYDLQPDDFDLLVSQQDPTFAGYVDEPARREGHRAFRIWHEQHAAQRPSASQPVKDEKE